jgi:DNA-binding XRE family transcriptional regulator
MAKKKTPSQVQLLRKICGLTQPQLAKMVGCSWRTIVSIENGQRLLTAEMANRIMIETGAHPYPLRTRAFTKGSTRHYAITLKTINGLPYTKEYFHSWRAARTTAKIGEAAKLAPSHMDLIETAQANLKAILNEAANKNQLWSALYLFNEWVKATARDLRLRQVQPARATTFLARAGATANHVAPSSGVTSSK